MKSPSTSPRGDLKSPSPPNEGDLPNLELVETSTGRRRWNDSSLSSLQRARRVENDGTGRPSGPRVFDDDGRRSIVRRISTYMYVDVCRSVASKSSTTLDGVSIGVSKKKKKCRSVRRRSVKNHPRQTSAARSTSRRSTRARAATRVDDDDDAARGVDVRARRCAFGASGERAGDGAATASNGDGDARATARRARSARRARAVDGG